MYFDFDDGHPDLDRIPRALSTREEVLMAIIVHLLVLDLHPDRPAAPVRQSTCTRG